jgi:hypothetical protein
MAVKTRAELKAENSTDFPDNNSRLISAAHLRGQMDDVADSAFLAEDLDQLGGPASYPVEGVQSFSTKIMLIDSMSEAERALLSTTGPYIDAILAAAIAEGSTRETPEIHFPFGTVRLATTVHLKKRVKFLGEGSGQSGRYPSVIIFDDNIDGFVVHRADTNAGGIESPQTTNADGCHVEGLRIIPATTASTLGSGVWMRAHATVQNCLFENWGEHGIKIVATAGSPTPFQRGNANVWHVQNVRISSTKSHGFYVDGFDANAGTAIGIDCSSCQGWGFYDDSFLGNTYVGCHTANNVLGPYTATEPNGQNCYVGCYAESGQPASNLQPRNMVIGGTYASAIDGGCLVLGENSITPFSVVNNESATQRTLRVNSHPSSGLDVLLAGDDAHGWSLAFWDPLSGTLQFRHNILADRVAFKLTTALAAAVDESDVPLGAGKMILDGVWVTALSGKYTQLDLLRAARRFQQQNVTNGGAFTLTPKTTPYHTLYSGAMLADRTATLSHTNVIAGTAFKITRTASGAFNLNVLDGTAGPTLKALAVNTWGEFAYNGTAYYLVAYGAL